MGRKPEYLVKAPVRKSRSNEDTELQAIGVAWSSGPSAKSHLYVKLNALPLDPDWDGSLFLFESSFKDTGEANDDGEIPF